LDTNKINLHVVYAAFVLLLFAPCVAISGQYFEDSFETGVLGEPPTYIDPVTDAGWTPGMLTEVVDASITEVPIHSGTKMLRFTFGTHNPDQYFTLGSNQTGDVYIRFYIYYPSGAEDGENAYVHRDGPSSDNNKMFRLWGDEYEDENKMGATADLALAGEVERQYLKSKISGEHVLDCAGTMGEPKNGDEEYLLQTTLESFHLGKWLLYEYHFKADTGVGDGIMEMYVGGVLVAGQTGLSWLGAPCDPGYFLNGYILGSANSGFDVDTNIYIDDVVFSDTYIGGDVLTTAIKATGITFTGVKF